MSQINGAFAIRIILLTNNFYWFRLLNKPKLQKQGNSILCQNHGSWDC